MSLPILFSSFLHLEGSAPSERPTLPRPYLPQERALISPTATREATSTYTPSEKPPAPLFSDSPWRYYKIEVGSDLFLGSSSSAAQTFKSDPPTLSLTHALSFISSGDGDFFLFGGEKTKHIRQLQFDAQNSIATIRNVSQVAPIRSPRSSHSAVMIGNSLMVIWGGQDINREGTDPSYSNSEIYISTSVSSTSLHDIQILYAYRRPFPRIRRMDQHLYNRTKILPPSVPCISSYWPHSIPIRRV